MGFDGFDVVLTVLRRYLTDLTSIGVGFDCLKWFFTIFQFSTAVLADGLVWF